jgi:hypothetical protein
VWVLSTGVRMAVLGASAPFVGAAEAVTILPEKDSVKASDEVGFLYILVQSRRDK